MSIKDIVTRKSNEERPARTADSLFSLHSDMNRLFDDFFRGFELVPFEGGRMTAVAGFNPRVNISETEKEISISAELPGMDDKDVTVELEDEALTLRGEKKEEHEEKGRNWHRVESSYGSFHRVIALPSNVDSANARASFKKGVLSVTLPKRPEEQSKKKKLEIAAG